MMEKITIEGGKRLSGEITVHGAKNSALPILAATVLTTKRTVIHNCPRLTDIDAAINILKHLGCVVQFQDDSVIVDASNINCSDIPDNLMREMRSSVVFLGAILARTGKASFSTPGGCEIGLRPIDLHLFAMGRLGAKVKEEYGKLECECPNGLVGDEIILSFPSVGATENAMLAAVLAKGKTTIINCAREPEISDLADFLNGCGARISGAGEGTIVVDG
ncbi:MAG: UDP-N-acetylglucosamine 1-carboxyvinyltransferase, partial [Oscillospiraceae bacterium]